jgi:hypothetical protein
LLCGGTVSASAGERRLAHNGGEKGGESESAMKPAKAFDICHDVYASAREIMNSRMATIQMTRASKFTWRPDLRPRLVDYVADFARAGERALSPSRLILFRLHYLGGCEYQLARQRMGLSEAGWENWTDEIRHDVGRELLRAGMFPPSRYFREMSAQAAEAGRADRGAA